MAEAYNEAAIRHFFDAEELARRARFDNAAHLVGFAAECAIKHAVHSVRHAPKGIERAHLPILALIALKGVSGRNPSSVPIFSLLRSCRGAFFQDWDVSDRYSKTNHIDQDRYNAWKILARRTIAAAGLGGKP